MKQRPLKSGPIPRYLQIADLIRQQIGRGQLRPGQRLPTLATLVEEFGVARVTVRQAIETLAREGLVSPQQGRGTFITGAPPEDRWFHAETTLAGIDRICRLNRPTVRILEEGRSEPALAPGDGRAAERYVSMRRVHSRDGVPYCVLTVHLAEDLFQRAPSRFRTEAILPVLTDDPDLKISGARQVMTIGSTDLDLAQLLEIPVGSPIAEVRRQIVDGEGRVIYAGDISYRGDVLRLEMDLGR